MKTLLIFINVFLCGLFTAQEIAVKELFTDNVSIRAIRIWDGKIWYAGTDSKFGYVSIANPKDQKQIRLQPDSLVFRTLAQNRNKFFMVNIESPAYFYMVDKKTLTPSIIAKSGEKHVFYDALHFIDENKGIAFSDPKAKCGYLSYLYTKGDDVVVKTDSCFVNFDEGEAAFAASNTNIASSKKYVWIATGGKKSRILRLNMRSGKWKTFETPFIQGNSSQGIYSIDFYKNRFGVAVGGDYTRQLENINNIATTRNGGRTWRIVASRKNGGYKTCVRIKPGTRGKEIISVGDQNIEYSKDYGQTWAIIAAEKNLYTAEWIDDNAVIIAGKNRIIKLTIYN